MSTPALLEPPAQQDGAPERQANQAHQAHQAHQARLHALRPAAQRLDPVRLHYLDVLAQRSATAPEALQRVLDGKLDAALTDFEERLRRAHAAAPKAVAQLSAAPLTALNQYLQGVKPPDADDLSGFALDSRPHHGLPRNGKARTELASVRRFREVWSRIAAEDQVLEAVERGPTNAGPLNAHRLTLRTLARLRELSPDYLQRFLSQVETLQWLEQASQTITPVKPKPARRSRVKKA